jgi:hypothetical protein
MFIIKNMFGKYNIRQELMNFRDKESIVLE